MRKNGFLIVNDGLRTYEGFFVNGLMDGFIIMRYLYDGRLHGEALYNRGILIRSKSKEIDTPHNKYCDTHSCVSCNYSYIKGLETYTTYLSNENEECIINFGGRTRMSRTKTNTRIVYRGIFMRGIDNDGKIKFIRHAVSICTYEIGGNIDTMYGSTVRFYQFH